MSVILFRALQFKVDPNNTKKKKKKAQNVYGFLDNLI